MRAASEIVDNDGGNERTHLNKTICAKAPSDRNLNVHSNPPCNGCTHLPFEKASKTPTPCHARNFALVSVSLPPSNFTLMRTGVQKHRGGRTVLLRPVGPETLYSSSEARGAPRDCPRALEHPLGANACPHQQYKWSLLPTARLVSPSSWGQCLQEE